MPRGGRPTVPGAARRSRGRGDRRRTRPRSSRRGCRAMSPNRSIERVARSRPAAPSRCTGTARSAGSGRTSSTSSASSRMRWSITGTTTSAVACAARCRRERGLRVELASEHDGRSRGRARALSWAKPHAWNSGAATTVALARLHRDPLSSEASGSIDLRHRTRGALRRAGRAAGEDDRATLLLGRGDRRDIPALDQVLQPRVLRLAVVGVVPGDVALAPRAGVLGPPRTRGRGSAPSASRAWRRRSAADRRTRC